MIVIPGRIPILIHPFFWILASVIGILYGGFSLLALVWLAIVFISVLFHEMGHALTALMFKQHPQISLVALGGLTTYEGKGLNFIKQFLIVLNGPIFGLVLCFFSYKLLTSQFFENSYIVYFLSGMWKINLFWSAINLVPILPLDGGQLMRIVFEAIFGEKGFRVAIFLGMVLAFALGICSFIFLKGLWLVGMVFFLFAFQNFELFRKSKLISKSDRDEGTREQIALAEQALAQGNKQEAKRHLEEIRGKGEKGLIFSTATQYLALIEFEAGKKKEAYDLLITIEEELAAEAKIILHELSFEFENYELVAKLSQKCYQLLPSQKIAFMNARAFGHLKQSKPAGGWLQTALEYGSVNLNEVLEENAFKEIKDDPDFKAFF